MFLIGQFFIQYIFIASFNYKNINYYKNVFIGFNEIDIINTNFYKYDLNNYLNNNALIISFIMFITLGLLLYLRFKKYKSKNKLLKKDFISITFNALIISLFFNSFIYLLNNTIHITDNYNISSIPLYIQIITSGIIGPILEELLFRGVIYNKLKEFDLSKAKIYTSILFSLFHFPNIITVIYTFILSFIMIHLYEKYKTLKANILFHIVINITAIISIYILVINNILLNIALLLISLFFIFLSSIRKL